MQRKKNVPYSKPLAELIKSGFAPNNDVNIFIGNDAWRKAGVFSISYPERTLALPPWHNPFHYYWPVRECSIIVCDTGYAEPDYLYDLAECLYEHGADKVHLITPDYKFITYHKEECHDQR